MLAHSYFFLMAQEQSSEDIEQVARQIMQPNPPKAQPPKYQPEEMPFLDHLEELRWRIIKGLIGVSIGVVLAFVFSSWIMDNLLLGPARGDFFMYRLVGVDATDLILQNRRLPGQFFTYIGTLLVVGLIIGAPILFYQLWAFIAPALNPNERGNSRFIVFNMTFLFMVGVAFGYLILTPFALQFFNSFYISDMVRNDFDINAYFTAITLWTITCGVIFQLPLISYVLSKAGLLTPEFMIKYRKYALLLCFVLAAVLTPPDPVSQILVAIPLILLYQLGIFISRITHRRRKKEIFGEA